MLVLFELPSNFFVLLLDVLEVALPGVEVMLVLPTVKASVVFLHNLGLLVEELTLLILVLSLLLAHDLTPTVITSEHPLDGQRCFQFVLVLPLLFEHSPVLLDDHCGSVFLISEFLGLVELHVVRVYQVSVSVLTLFQVKGHLFKINKYKTNIQV